MSKLEKWSLVSILLLGAVLRLFPLLDAHYLYDEFTASIVRTNYPSFSAMTEGAVMSDYHPPGTHIFLYYWTQLVGTDAWIVKLPFVISGITSIYFIYAIGRRWFTWQTGILTAALFACMQYSISYAIMARPYALGLFFTLVLVWSLTVIVQDTDKRSWKYFGLFILAGFLAASMHYISMLTAGITGIIGLIIIPKELRWKLILSGVIIVLLFLPELPVVIHQLGKGGVGGESGWLSPPSSTFLFEYIYYLHHYSIFSLGITLVIGILSWSNKSIVLNKRAIFIGLTFFFSVFLISYIYSLKVNPIIQYSVLIFVHFWLYYILFAKASFTPKPFIFALSSIVLIHLFSLESNREYFSTYQKTPYQAILEDAETHPNIPHLVDADPTNFHYEIDQHATSRNFDYRQIRNFNENGLMLYLDSVSQLHDQCYLGAMFFNKASTVPIINLYYPTLEQQSNYFGATSYLFSKDLSNKYTSLYGKSATDSLEFGSHSEIQIENRTIGDFIDFKLHVKFTNDIPEDFLIVTEVKHQDSLIQWHGQTYKDTYIKGKEEQIIVHSLQLTQDNYHPDYTYSTYIWNPNKTTYSVKSFEYRTRNGNPKIFGRIHPF